jgi:hypothetical protein
MDCFKVLKTPTVQEQPSNVISRGTGTLATTRLPFWSFKIGLGVPAMSFRSMRLTSPPMNCKHVEGNACEGKSR